MNLLNLLDHIQFACEKNSIHVIAIEKALIIKPSNVCRLSIQSNVFVPDRSLKIITLHSREPVFMKIAKFMRNFPEIIRINLVMKCTELILANCTVFVNKLSKDSFTEPNQHIFPTIRIFFVYKIQINL